MSLLTNSVRRVVSNFSICPRPGAMWNFWVGSRRINEITSQQVSRGYEMFDPRAYLKYHYGEVDAFHRHSLKHIHEFCKSYGALSTGLKMLEFGAGPVIANVISASLYASEIVLSEYLETNRKVLQMWLDRDPNAPNWSPFFEYVVQELEGESKQEAGIREEELRQVIQAVIACDIHKDPPVEPAYLGPYDLVLSSYCLESACNSLEEFSGAVSKLAKLTKPGGKLIIVTMEGPGETFFYVVGEKKFINLSITKEALTTILQQNEFHDITIECQPNNGPDWKILPERCNYKSKLICIATKSK